MRDAQEFSSSCVLLPGVWSWPEVHINNSVPWAQLWKKLPGQYCKGRGNGWHPAEPHKATGDLCLQRAGGHKHAVKWLQATERLVPWVLDPHMRHLFSQHKIHTGVHVHQNLYVKYILMHVYYVLDSLSLSPFSHSKPILWYRLRTLRWTKPLKRLTD